MDLELYSSCQKQNVVRFFFTMGNVGLSVNLLCDMGVCMMCCNIKYFMVSLELYLHIIMLPEIGRHQKPKNPLHNTTWIIKTS